MEYKKPKEITKITKIKIIYSDVKRILNHKTLNKLTDQIKFKVINIPRFRFIKFIYRINCLSSRFKRLAWLIDYQI